MNSIVRKHYPVSSLPRDLREGLPEHGWVRLKIVPEPGEPTARPVSPLVSSARRIHGNEEAVLSNIRAMRDDD